MGIKVGRVSPDTCRLWLSAYRVAAPQRDVPRHAQVTLYLFPSHQVPRHSLILDFPNGNAAPPAFNALPARDGQQVDLLTVYPYPSSREGIYNYACCVVYVPHDHIRGIQSHGDMEFSLYRERVSFSVKTFPDSLRDMISVCFSFRGNMLPTFTVPPVDAGIRREWHLQVNFHALPRALLNIFHGVEPQRGNNEFQSRLSFSHTVSPFDSLLKHMIRGIDSV